LTQSTHSGRGVTAVLGPTNTGKTHLAIERMTAYPSGVIGLPLRLLAREVYHRVCDKVGTANVALVTGEEKIAPPNARFQVCTVEAMPHQTDAEFVAIDEIQLATDLERGHVFTDRILNLRGTHETMLLGAATVQKTLRELLPGINIVTRPRMSVLSYAGSKKITRLPRKSAIIAFSAEEVYAIAELIRRQRGGAAVVMGSLSPRTRNAQVALFQSGDVDFIVATDAIGMGLNLDLDHVAFAQDQKFDGHQIRKLTASELAQVAGRAGRHTQDGTFGVTGQVDPFPDGLVEALETHEFAPQKVLSWRNRQLEFSNLDALKASLDQNINSPYLMKSPPTSDTRALEALSREAEISGSCNNHHSTQMLWDICRIPDYRRISPAAHASILKQIYLDINEHQYIDETWFAEQISHSDHTDGEIDALSARIAHIRTWTYVSNRENWLKDAGHWQEKTQEVENRLSDALHEKLTKRFIDRRTSVLMKRLRENAMLEAEITDDGNVSVEGHHVGQLHGFRFVADQSAQGPEAKAANAAAAKALASEIERRVEKLAAAPNSDFSLGDDGVIRWLGSPVAKITGADETLKPRILLLADEQLTGNPLEKAQARLDRWMANHINTLLKPLQDLVSDTTLDGMAKGVAYRLHENLGILKRNDIAEDIRGLDQDMRAGLRKHGVRFGAHHIFIPAMLKPAPTSLICFLWSVKNDQLEAEGLTEIPLASAAGRTSLPVNSKISEDIYRLCGFRILGKKAVRIDILERLADLIRPTTTWKPGGGNPKPDGAIDGRAFFVTPAMMSILGATHEDMEEILNGLGYRGEAKLKDDIVPKAPEPEPAIEPENSGKADITPPTPQEANKAASELPETEIAEAPQILAGNISGKEDEEPKTIKIWRYGHAERTNKFTRNKPQQTKGKQATAKTAGKKQQSKPRRPSQAKQPEPKLDPDSPFAKLAALKESMKQ